MKKEEKIVYLCTMELTIIISTYNRAESLLRTLNSVIQQDADPATWECLVVNNASTDNTKKLFDELAQKHPDFNLRMVDEEQQGLSFARNKGIAESKGRYVAFIDDDETVAPTFVSGYMSLFNAGYAFVAMGAVIPVYESGRPKWMSTYTEKMIANPIDLGDTAFTISHKIVPAGGNMAFNRELFNIYGSFDTDLGRIGKELRGGEETELFRRIRSLGERVFYAPKAIVYHHIGADKLTEEYVDKLSYGVGCSKRIQAEKEGTLNELYDDESRKRLYTFILSAFYTLTFRPAKSKWLWRMRNGITRGIKGC